jgi:predicted enzyme related to lactoylglutathione lyase
MIRLHGISELVLEVRDLAQAEEFYGGPFGLELTRWEPRITLVQGHGCHLQLRLVGSPGHRGAGPCHFAFSVDPDAIPEIAAHLQAHGKLTRGPVDFGEGGLSVFCFDPDGNEVEFNDSYRRAGGEHMEAEDGEPSCSHLR